MIWSYTYFPVPGFEKKPSRFQVADTAPILAEVIEDWLNRMGKIEMNWTANVNDEFPFEYPVVSHHLILGAACEFFGGCAMEECGAALAEAIENWLNRAGRIETFQRAIDSMDSRAYMAMLELEDIPQQNRFVEWPMPNDTPRCC